MNLRIPCPTCDRTLTFEITFDVEPRTWGHPDSHHAGSDGEVYGPTVCECGETIDHAEVYRVAVRENEENEIERRLANL